MSQQINIQFKKTGRKSFLKLLNRALKKLEDWKIECLKRKQKNQKRKRKNK